MQLVHSHSPRNKVWVTFIPWVVGLVGGIVPLWLPRRLPIVDMPQHLHLISVMHRLADSTTLYPEYFQLRRAFTPYFGYYFSVDALSYLMPLEVANRVFLSLYIVSLPLAVAFLLRTFRRATWPALLTIPFTYGDSLAWGFINSSVSFSFAIFSAACFVRAIEDVQRRRRWGIATAILLVLVLMFHVQPFIFLAFALPFLLFTSKAPDGWRAKRTAVVSVLPSVALFLYWLLSRATHPAKIVSPENWNVLDYPSYATGPFFSTSNFEYLGFPKNLHDLVYFPGSGISRPQFPLLGSFAHGSSEHLGLLVIFVVAIVASILGLVFRSRSERSRGGYRLLGLATLSALLYFCLPINIRGYMQFINIRYATYIAVFLVAAIPALPSVLRPFLPGVAMASTLIYTISMAKAFWNFDKEWRDLGAIAEAAPPRAKVMGLIYDTSSYQFTHPLFLHAATEVAREKGGITNYSFALTAHSPLQYRRDPPPSFPNEWYPQAMNWEMHGSHYDCFVLRGTRPEWAFGAHLNRDVFLRKESGRFSLYCRP